MKMEKKIEQIFDDKDKNLKEENGEFKKGSSFLNFFKRIFSKKSSSSQLNKDAVSKQIS